MNKKIRITLISVLVFALLGLFIWLTGAQLAKAIFTTGRTFDFFLLLILVFTAVAIFFFMRGYKQNTRNNQGSNYYGRSSGYDSPGSGRSKKSSVKETPTKTPADHHVALYWLGSITGVLGLALLVTFCVRVSYDSDHAYVSSIKTTTASVPSFDSRAPYKVAVESASRMMGSVTGTAETVKSVADLGKTGEWDTLIVRQGIGVGYQAVQVVSIPLYGAVNPSNVTFCYFNRSAGLRFGGALIQNNLDRVLDWKLPLNVSYDTTDSYGICNGSTPEVIIPLKQVNGFYGAYETPYGVAIYNGKTGDITVTTNSATIAKIPGSTYPMSLVVAQRKATQAVGTLGDYLFGATGYQTTSVTDSSDPNAENDSEFKLRYTDNGNNSVAYVTPLTVRGSSSSIVGLAVSESRSFTPGQLNPYTVYRYNNNTNRQANSTVDKKIRDQFAVVQAGYAAGVRVFEVVPGASGSWVASIGENQVVSYRAIITQAGKITLYNSDGQEVDPNSANGTPLANTPSTSTGTVKLPSNLQGLDLAKLTNAQLEELSGAIVSELGSRSNR